MEELKSMFPQGVFLVSATGPGAAAVPGESIAAALGS